MNDLLLMLPWFLAVSAFVLLIYFAVASLQGSPESAGISQGPDSATPSQPVSPNSSSPPGGTIPRATRASSDHSADSLAQARERMVQAGLYSPNAPIVFAVTKFVLAGCMLALGLGIASLGFLPLPIALGIGLLCGLAGTIAPSLWLDHVRRERQKQIRRSLPDALDVISICLAGGLSFSAAIVRVARELGTAHPLLANELAIVERETQLGLTNGEALRQFADRFDMEELRSLASVIKHAEKLGGSVTKALEVYAETLRTKRHQRAEELAQKAAVKILFPTAFCIFPGLFIVILGPAVVMVVTQLFPAL